MRESSTDLRKELGQVDVHDGLQQQLSLVLVKVLELQVSSCSQHRLDCPHAVVVVVLGGQQFRAEAVCCNDFPRQTAGDSDK